MATYITPAEIDTPTAPVTFGADRHGFLRTSYANQRQIAARELPAGTVCIHGVTVERHSGCASCYVSGVVLLPR